MRDTAQPPNEEDRLRLTGHRLLHDLEEASRDALVGSFHVADVPAGQTVLEEGQTNAVLFVVLKGSISVRLPKNAQRVSEVKLATLGAGDIFGEYSLFDGQPVSATVFATEPTRVAWLEKSAVDEFVVGHGEVGRRFYENILRILVERLRAKDAELDIISVG